MTVITDSTSDTGVPTAELQWDGLGRGSQGPQQEQALVELVDLSSAGLVIDCSKVLKADPQLLELLMRVKQHASVSSKHLALFNAPRDLRNMIVMRNLRLALPIFKGASAAEKLITKLARFRV